MKRIAGLALINLLFIVVLGLIAPYFFTKANLVVVMDNMALEAIILGGYTLLLVGGYFDLSVDGIVALTGVLAGMAIVSGLPWPMAMIFSLFVAGCIGLLNGYVVAKLRINGLIATLTTWWICVGVSLGLTKALSPYGFPDTFQLIGQFRVMGFRVSVMYAIVIVAILAMILQSTKIGSHTYISGDNRTAAEMMGIDVVRLGMGLYMLMALLSGFIGVVLAARLNAASPVAVDGMALRVIAAAVIGGCSLSGGKGNIIGGLLGLSIMHILSNAVIQLGWSPYWQKAILGGILLAAVLAERINFVVNRRIENA
jgi:ribose transport system permease protein